MQIGKTSFSMVFEKAKTLNIRLEELQAEARAIELEFNNEKEGRNMGLELMKHPANNEFGFVIFNREQLLHENRQLFLLKSQA